MIKETPKLTTKYGNPVRLRPDRTRKKTISAFFDIDVCVEFKNLAESRLATKEDMLHEAVALLFRKYNRPIPPGFKHRIKKLGLD
jgi:hypothetical protein